jgi:hypothetical protein
VVAEQTVYHDRSRPSRLVVPVVPHPPERTLERTFAERISRARISEFHRRLTERPHRSGTEGAHAVARSLESTLREAGLEVEIEEYQAFLSAPKRVSVDILSPTAETLSLWEPADPRDPDSSHPELEPPGSRSQLRQRDRRCDLYGLRSPVTTMASTPGKVVLVRYRKTIARSRSRRRRKKCLAILVYSDPEDDGAGKGRSGPGRFATDHAAKREALWFWHGTLRRGAATSVRPSRPAKAPPFADSRGSFIRARPRRFWNPSSGVRVRRCRAGMGSSRFET